MNEQLDKEKLVLDFFIKHPSSYIREIAEATKVSKSSVQRYLQRNAGYRLDTGVTIGEQLRCNQESGRKKGGETYFQNNTPTRGEKGQFTGSKASTTEEDKVEQKKRDIIFLCNYYVDNYPITFKEMAEQLEELELFTKDYIYHCLTINNLEEIVGEEIASEIYKKLDSSRYSFDKKVGYILSEAPFDLTPGEDMVIGLRRNNKSQEEVARIIGVSRGTIQKWEMKAIDKIKGVKK